MRGAGLTAHMTRQPAGGYLVVVVGTGGGLNEVAEVIITLDIFLPTIVCFRWPLVILDSRQKVSHRREEWKTVALLVG